MRVVRRGPEDLKRRTASDPKPPGCFRGDIAGVRWERHPLSISKATERCGLVGAPGPLGLALRPYFFGATSRVTVMVMERPWMHPMPRSKRSGHGSVGYGISPGHHAMNTLGQGRREYCRRTGFLRTPGIAGVWCGRTIGTSTQVRERPLAASPGRSRLWAKDTVKRVRHCGSLVVATAWRTGDRACDVRLWPVAAAKENSSEGLVSVSRQRL